MWGTGLASSSHVAVSLRVRPALRQRRLPHRQHPAVARGVRAKQAGPDGVGAAGRVGERTEGVNVANFAARCDVAAAEGLHVVHDEGLRRGRGRGEAEAQRVAGRALRRVGLRARAVEGRLERSCRNCRKRRVVGGVGRAPQRRRGLRHDLQVLHELAGARDARGRADDGDPALGGRVRLATAHAAAARARGTHQSPRPYERRPFASRCERR